MFLRFARYQIEIHLFKLDNAPNRDPQKEIFKNLHDNNFHLSP